MITVFSKVEQKVFKPAHCFEVKVVGWLVQNQNVRIAKQSLSQKHFNLYFRVGVAIRL